MRTLANIPADPLAPEFGDDQAPADLARRTAAGLREMIIRHQLSPGEQIRQVELAARLGVSRSPLREALRSLETEGLVVHTPNRGYFVTRLSAAELRQIYRMRRLLETDLYRSLQSPTADDLESLRSVNARVRSAIDRDSLAAMLTANREFHFTLFALSAEALVIREIERLWRLSEPYRATYLWIPERRTQVLLEHEWMVAALTSGDIDGLIRIADQHRSVAEAIVTSLLELA